MKKLVLIALVLLLSGQLYCQHIRKTVVLPEFSVKNKELLAILDSVTSYERTCPYYSDSVFFIFNCRDIENTVEVTIYALNTMNSEMDSFEFDDIIGYCQYDDFVIFINRKARDLFFAIEGNERLFHYVKYDDTYQPKDKLIVYYIIDDSFTIWRYFYVVDHFVFDGKSGCY